MNQEWSNTLTGTDENKITCVKIASSGDIYAAGYTYSSVIGDESSTTTHSYGSSDGFIIRYTPDGVVAWTRRIGGTQTDKIKSITLDTNGFVYVAGFTSSQQIGNETTADNLIYLTDAYFAKYNDAGQLLWLHRIGGFVYDSSIIIDYHDPDSIYIAGYSSANNAIQGELGMTQAYGLEDGFLSKYNEHGEQQWVIRLGGTSNDRINGMVCGHDNYVYVCGTTGSDSIGNETSAQNSLGALDGFIAKYDNRGQIVWLHRIGGDSYDDLNVITIDSDNNIYVAGQTNSKTIANEKGSTMIGITDVFIAKYSQTGTLQWTQRFGAANNSPTISAIASGADKSFFIAGTTQSKKLTGEFTNTTIGTTDSYVVKYMNNGQQQWVHRVGTSQAITAITSIAVDDRGNIIDAGQINANSSMWWFFDFPELKYAFIEKSKDTTYVAPVQKIDYCLKPGRRSSKAMCSTAAYSPFVTSGNNPQMTKSQKYAQYVRTVTPSRHIFRRLPPNRLTSQIISTYAGTGASGTSGDGGVAILAKFKNPYCCNFDNSSNMYISDDSNRVRKISVSTNMIHSVVGNGIASRDSLVVGDGGPALQATMNKPVDTIVDASKNIYICDENNMRIRKVNYATGIITTIVGTGYVTTNNQSNLGDGGLAIHATVNRPQGICFDNSGNLLIADTGNHLIRKVDSSGIIHTIAGSQYLSPNGDGSLATSVNLRSPSAICVDQFNNVYIADTGNRRIRKIDSSGIIQTIAGTGNSGFNGENMLAKNANLGTIEDIIIDNRKQFLYIADSLQQRVRKINISTNTITTVAGTGESGYSGDNGLAVSAKLNYPKGLSMDNLGNLYIADMSNFVIRKVSA